MSAKKSDRRQFLRNSAALAAFAAGAAAVRSAGAQALPPASNGGRAPAYIECEGNGCATASGQSLQDVIAQAAAKTYEGTPGPGPGQHLDPIYGVRSRYETAGRIGGIGAFHHGPNGKFSRPFLGALTPIQDLFGIITPAALHFYESHGYIPPRHRPQAASSPDSRHGGPSSDFHLGRAEAPAFRNPNSFHRVRWKRRLRQAWERAGSDTSDDARVH